MFDVYCPSCASRRLIFTGQIRKIDNAGDGIHVSFTCWCGADSVWRTGRRAEGSAPATALRQAS